VSDKEDKDARSQRDPITYMRSRHPDLYSDSETIIRPQLTEDILEYRLQTLTNRNQETEFAYFARRLAQKEICPNLRPQTGPVGGGDSKVDSETIPVSSDVADVWVGTDPVAATERWAFAFSAKKDWKTKAAQDVEKIAGTNRGYTRIYFITAHPSVPRVSPDYLAACVRTEEGSGCFGGGRRNRNSPCGFASLVRARNDARKSHG
jgi:hypothetical protein